MWQLGGHFHVATTERRWIGGLKRMLPGFPGSRFDELW